MKILKFTLIFLFCKSFFGYSQDIKIKEPKIYFLKDYFTKKENNVLQYFTIKKRDTLPIQGDVEIYLDEYLFYSLPDLNLNVSSDNVAQRSTQCVERVSE
jgi:hypothetical protein